MLSANPRGVYVLENITLARPYGLETFDDSQGVPMYGIFDPSLLR